MGSIIDKINEDIEGLDQDLRNDVWLSRKTIAEATKEQMLRDRNKKDEEVKGNKPLFVINIRYRDSEDSTETSHASFTVRSVSAQSALSQKDVKSFLADNDFVCHLSVDEVGSGQFGKREDDGY